MHGICRQHFPLGEKEGAAGLQSWMHMLCPVCLWWLAVRGFDCPSEVQKVVVNSVSLLAFLSDITSPLSGSFGIS